MTKEHMNGNESINTFWEKGRELLVDIDKAGGMQEYLAQQNPARVAEAFPSSQSCLCCMDERIPAGVRLPGSGIFEMDDPEKRAFLIARLKEAGVKDVSLHKGCGAVAIYAKLNNISLEEAEERAEAWAKELSKELGGEYKGTVSVSPEEFHIAHGAYYDLTGTFQPSNAPDLFPAGFVISSSFTAEGGVGSLEAGIGIAMGDHAFGNRFNTKDKFRVVIVANSNEEAENAEKEILASKVLASKVLDLALIKVEFLIKPAVVKG